MRKAIGIAALAVFTALVLGFGTLSPATQHTRDGPTLGIVSVPAHDLVLSSVVTNLSVPLSNSSVSLSTDSSSSLATATDTKDATWMAFTAGTTSLLWFGVAAVLLLMMLHGMTIVNGNSVFGRFSKFVKRSFDQLGGAAVRQSLRTFGLVTTPKRVALGFAAALGVISTTPALAGNGGYLGQSDTSGFPMWTLIALALGSMTLVAGGIITRRTGQ